MKSTRNIACLSRAAMVWLTLTMIACSSSSDESFVPAEPAADGAASSVEQTVSDFVGDQPGGIDILIRDNGISTRAAAGIADNDGTVLMPGRPFRVGSISKPFVAVLVMQLVDEGLVELEESLGTYLPGISVGADVTIRQLLNHTSGIANYTENEQIIADVLADREREFTPAEILGYVEVADSGDPGTFAYSNTNYILLGQLVEQVDGRSLNESLARRIAEPLGLVSTSFAIDDASTPDDLVAGWGSQGLLTGDLNAPYTSIASGAWAAGALVSTTDELMIFLDALTSGALVSQSSLEQMTNFGDGESGLGVFEIFLDANEPGFGHSGRITGFTSIMAIAPGSGRLIVSLNNNDELENVNDLLLELLGQM